MKADINLPLFRCQKCGTIMEWRFYKNVSWTRPHKAYRYQLYCPKCKKMRKGRINADMPASRIP